MARVPIEWAHSLDNLYGKLSDNIYQLAELLRSSDERNQTAEDSVKTLATAAHIGYLVINLIVSESNSVRELEFLEAKFKHLAVIPKYMTTLLLQNMTLTIEHIRAEIPPGYTLFCIRDPVLEIHAREGPESKQGTSQKPILITPSLAVVKKEGNPLRVQSNFERTDGYPIKNYKTKIDAFMMKGRIIRLPVCVTEEDYVQCHRTESQNWRCRREWDRWNAFTHNVSVVTLPPLKLILSWLDENGQSLYVRGHTGA